MPRNKILLAMIKAGYPATQKSWEDFCIQKFGKTGRKRRPIEASTLVDYMHWRHATQGIEVPERPDLIAHRTLMHLAVERQRERALGHVRSKQLWRTNPNMKMPPPPPNRRKGEE